eukprot:1296545-Prymnesium_polylepis.1
MDRALGQLSCWALWRALPRGPPRTRADPRGSPRTPADPRGPRRPPADPRGAANPRAHNVARPRGSWTIRKCAVPAFCRRRHSPHKGTRHAAG